MLSRSQAQWAYYNNDSSRFSIDASVILLDREGDDNNVALIQNDLTLAPLLTSGQATDLNTTAGIEMAMMFHGPAGREIEIESSYAQWDTAFSFFGENLETPFLPNLNPHDINYAYDSQLFSIEVNIRREWTPGLTFLIGPRFLSLQEHTEFDSQTTIIIPPPQPNVEFVTRNVIDTTNPLIGGQIGMEWDFQLSRDLYVNSYIKAGAFGNAARATLTSETTIQALLEERRTKNSGAFVGEVGGRLNYSIFPSALSAFVGYQAMWIDGVALAPPQFINVNNDGALFVANTPFFHGAVFGLEARY
jgi:hypothetical protein